jgi:uncharacterized membrane protein
VFSNFFQDDLSTLTNFYRKELMLLLTVILLAVAIISSIVLLVTYKPQSKYNKGMLFAVTLPADVIEHSDLKSIQAGFNKQLLQASWCMAVLLVPFVLLHDWSAYQVIYFFVWISGFFVVMSIPFRHAFRSTLALKRENDWFVGKKRVIQGDLRVAHLKNQRAASLWLFTIPFAIAIGMMLWALKEDVQLLGISAGGSVVTVIFLLISIYARQKKAKVYSENSEVNVSLNQVNRRIMTYLWLFLAIVINIHFLFIYLLFINEQASMSGVWLTISLLFTVIPIGMILYAHRKFNVLEQEVMEQDGKPIYSDDDEYWSNGFTYHNPQDKSIFVTKRVGVGETVNTGTLVGKIIVWGTMGLTALLIIGTSFMLIRAENTSPILTVTPEKQIKIEYPMYSLDFNITDIEQIMLVDNVPSSIKTNGEATNKYARGHFRSKELGKTRLYIYKNNPPYIQIKLKDVYIFYNEKDGAQTDKVFRELQSQIGK